MLSCWVVWSMPTTRLSAPSEWAPALLHWQQATHLASRDYGRQQNMSHLSPPFGFYIENIRERSQRELSHGVPKTPPRAAYYWRSHVAKGVLQWFPLPFQLPRLQEYYLLINRGCTQTHLFKILFNLIHHLGCLLLLLPLTRDFATALKPPLPGVRACANLASANESVGMTSSTLNPSRVDFQDRCWIWFSCGYVLLPQLCWLLPRPEVTGQQCHRYLMFP